MTRMAWPAKWPTAEYQRERRRERLTMARARLGGRCARCGAVDNLDFDHIDPATKAGNISEITNWALARFLAEVDKCQLLCHGSCHVDKSIRDYPTACGSGLGRSRCPCDQCRAWRREYHTAYMRRYRLARSSPG